jgi:hypothetical protein
MTLPFNGLIYVNGPVRIVNASNVPDNLNIVSNSTIYTKGDFNKVKSKNTALITSQRIYHLTEGFKDSDSNNSKPSKGDEKDGTVEIYSNIVDGAPTLTEINYVKSWEGVSNPLYDPRDTPNGKYCWANSDAFLEDLSGLTVKKRGTIAHLGNGKMAKLDNSNAGPGVTAWIMKSHYNPPVRDYDYDPLITAPLFLPKVFTITYRNQSR